MGRGPSAMTTTNAAGGTECRFWTEASVESLLIGLIGLSVVVPLLLCLWTLDRGFDLTDESNSLLLAMDPASFRIFVSAALWPTSYLWAATRSLVAYRALGVSLILVASLVLATGAWRAAVAFDLVRESRRTAMVAAGLSALGGALHWHTYGVSVFFTPSYNLLAVAAGYMSVGLLLFSFVAQSLPIRLFLALFAGVCIGIATLCKFPTGICLLALALAMLFALQNCYRMSVSMAALVLIGASAAMLLIAGQQMPLDAVLDNFRLGLKFYQTALPEPISTRLIRNVSELTVEWSRTVVAFAVPLLLFAFYAVWRRPMSLLLGIVAMVVVLTAGGYFLADADLTKPDGHLGTQVRSLSALLLAGMVVVLPAARRTIQQMALLAVLFGLPYAIAFGTANTLPPQILVSMAPWAVLLAILAHARGLSVDRGLGALAICALFCVASGAQVSAAVFTGAYNLERPLSEQSLPVNIGRIGIVRLDDKAAQFVKDVGTAAARCRIPPDAPFIGLYNMPGVAVILRAKPILTTWLIDKSQADPWLAAANPEIVKSAVVAIQLQDDGRMPLLPAALDGFPSRYTMCGEGRSPKRIGKLQIWAPT